jgi:hypothetical protein
VLARSWIQIVRIAAARDNTSLHHAHGEECKSQSVKPSAHFSASCLGKSKFGAICKPTIQRELPAKACNGLGDLAQSAQLLRAVTQHEALRFQFDGALGLLLPWTAGSSKGKIGE